MSILVALVLGFVIQTLGPVNRRPLLAVFAASIVVLAGGAALGLPLYPWTNVPVLGFSVAGGMLIGRALPARGRAMLTLLTIVAVLDLVLVVVFGSSAPAAAGTSGPPPTAWYYGMLVLDTPWSHSEIGALDLLLVAAVIEHGRRRGLPPLAALIPGPLGFLYADITVVALRPSNMALVPFLLLGWITVEVANRLVGAGTRPPRGAARGH